MLFADSMSQLWLMYYGVSILVLGAVYLAFAFLPRLARLVLTWAIVGAIWMPASFSLPLVEEGEFYHGWAPSAMVAAVGFLEQDSAAFAGGLTWLLSGVVLGALVGTALWWWRRPSAEADNERTPPADGQSAPAREAGVEPNTRRREPVIG
ncbi:hypothetical protein P1P91_10135 [Halomonas piscis]|uniref:Uncharacterized protein n=1 Tax=Halomonas piscis TaxID=3031727 RepID=A0ABY9YWS9_9GAMM|nr:hypothetical protein [Halomonas piscis]WNK19226.1 hypothetical protein P1P91_10135 [Halomonas piscis]